MPENTHLHSGLIRMPSRRAFMAGAAATSLLALPACQSLGGPLSFTEAIRRLLLLSSERAFARLAAPGGYWDESVGRIGLDSFLGSRGGVLASILTSALFKSRLEDAFANFAVDASYRAAPVVADTVRTIGIANAIALIRGGPTAATGFLRQEMGFALVDAMIPQLSDALRLAQEPLVGQLLSALTGVQVSEVARSFAGEVNDVIWTEMGNEEAAIRANPQSSNDPLLVSVLTGSGAL